MMKNPSAASSSKKLIKKSDLFPEEIYEEILTRLPVKSLSRFKCVSKPWLSHISSPRFVKAHLLYCSNNFPRILFLYGRHPGVFLKHCSPDSFASHTMRFIDYPDNYLPKRPRLSHVIGSCNGLVCFSAGRDVFIWNPCTKLYRKMPPLITIYDTMDDDDDDDDNDWWIGDHAFVYNVVDDDYKVIVPCIKIGELQVNIYSLRANSWTTRVSVNENISPIDKPILFDGKILMETDLDDQDDPDFISWDLETGVYSMFEEPDYGDGIEAVVMKALGGLFCVVCRKKTHVDLWVMKEFGVNKSWTKMLIVEYPYHIYMSHNPFFILPSGEILVSYRARSSRYEVYNPKDKSTRVLPICKTEKLIGAYLYVESLVSPIQREILGGQEDQ